MGKIRWFEDCDKRTGEFSPFTLDITSYLAISNGILHQQTLIFIVWGVGHFNQAEKGMSPTNIRSTTNKVNTTWIHDGWVTLVCLIQVACTWLSSLFYTHIVWTAINQPVQYVMRWESFFWCPTSVSMHLTLVPPLTDCELQPQLSIGVNRVSPVDWRYNQLSQRIMHLLCQRYDLSGDMDIIWHYHIHGLDQIYNIYTLYIPYL